MARRIDPETDKKILAAVALGMLSKDAAEKYGVSPSYVSKLTSGKKNMSYGMPDIRTLIEGDLELYEEDLDALLINIADTDIFLDPLDPRSYLDALIKRTLVRLKIYLELKKKIEGDINAK